jgi:hypothetical protein
MQPLALTVITNGVFLASSARHPPPNFSSLHKLFLQRMLSVEPLSPHFKEEITVVLRKQGMDYKSYASQGLYANCPLNTLRKVPEAMIASRPSS